MENQSNVIRSYIYSNGYNQTRLSEELGIRQQSLSNYINRVRPISINNLKVLCDSINMPLDKGTELFNVQEEVDYEERNRRQRMRYRANVFLKRQGIERECCQICKEEKTEIHHPDYSKELSINFLCAKCHNKVTYYGLKCPSPIDMTDKYNDWKSKTRYGKFKK